MSSYSKPLMILCTVGAVFLNKLTENRMNMAPESGKNILLIGASGGLGNALAAHYARHDTHLVLWGRKQDQLEALARQCRDAGSSVQLHSRDLQQIDHAVDDLIALDRQIPIDLAIFSAGQGDVRPAGAIVESAELIARLTTVNFTAQAALSAALAERMAQRGHGQIVLIGSAAGFHALPFAAAYAASKAGLARFADALRINMRPHGVSVTLVSPGFIDTPAAHHVPGPKPLIMSPAQAAKRIAKAAEKGRAHLVMHWPFALLRLIDRILPRFLKDHLLRSLTP